MISTDDFYDDLLIRIDRELETQGTLDGDNKENILTRLMIEDLSSGNAPAIRGAQETSRYANLSLDARINGFYLDEAENSVVVYITVYNASKELYRLPSIEVNRAFKKLHNFMSNIYKNPERMFDIIHEDNPYFEILYDLTHNSFEIDNFTYILLTNGYVGEIKLPSQKLNNKKVDFAVFDIERYRRFKAGQTVTHVDAKSDILGKPIPCSHVSSELYDTYCCIIPGEVLYRLFDAYHYQLLNSNVRTYLQLRGGVNKGIMDTIQNNPECFLAYNNGISATASKVSLDCDSNIIELYDFQIVNGGQTSASIYNAKANKGFDISHVNVMAKVTVIKNKNTATEMVKNISRYANTQNAIKFSDFSSNDSYNKKMAQLSRTIYTPAIGTKLQTKWYYENISGTYNNERSDSPSVTSFEKEYPKSQYFSKTDMAAYELSYQGFPAEACKGAQDAYKIFVMNLPDLKDPSESDFKQLVAKKILYDKVLSIIKEEGGGQGKAAMARYIVAYFSTIVCDYKFNLNEVWNQQEVPFKASNDLRNLTRKMMPILMENAQKNKKGVEMYCRMPSTWAAIKKINLNIETSGNYCLGESFTPAISVKGIPEKLAKFAISITDGAWADMAVNTAIIGDESKKDAGMCKTMIGISPEALSEKQIAYALRIVYRFFKNGFTFDGATTAKLEEYKEELSQIEKKSLKNFSTSKYFVQAKL